MPNEIAWSFKSGYTFFPRIFQELSRRSAELFQMTDCFRERHRLLRNTIGRYFSQKSGPRVGSTRKVDRNGSIRPTTRLKSQPRYATDFDSNRLQGWKRIRATKRSRQNIFVDGILWENLQKVALYPNGALHRDRPRCNQPDKETSEHNNYQGKQEKDCKSCR